MTEVGTKYEGQTVAIAASCPECERPWQKEETELRKERGDELSCFYGDRLSSRNDSRLWLKLPEVSMAIWCPYVAQRGNMRLFPPFSSNTV